MTRRRVLFPVLTALALGIGGQAAASAQATNRTLCDFNVAPVVGGTYTVQNNHWNSSAPQCVTTHGGADFTVANSAIPKTAGGGPGGYPSIFMGCHWGDCTRGGLASSPEQVLNAAVLSAVTSNWSTATPSGNGDAYDVAYDIWINQKPTTSGHPVGSEIMIWLKGQGGVQPAGSIVATGVWIGGYEYDVWYQKSSGSADVVTYRMTSPRSTVANLDISSLIRDAELRGYTNPSWYLISVEAGFEIWRGGAGLTTTNFSVSLNMLPAHPPLLGRLLPVEPVAQPYRR